MLLLSIRTNGLNKKQKVPCLRARKTRCSFVISSANNGNGSTETGGVPKVKIRPSLPDIGWSLFPVRDVPPSKRDLKMCIADDETFLAPAQSWLVVACLAVRLGVASDLYCLQPGRARSFQPLLGMFTSTTVRQVRVTYDSLVSLCSLCISGTHIQGPRLVS